MACAMLAGMAQVSAQDVKGIEFCDKKYEFAEGKDSITLFLKVLDSDGKSCEDVTTANLEKYLVMYEDKSPISPDRCTISALSSGQRIPANLTFSVLVDLSIPEEGKGQIYDAVGQLVQSAPDSCVFLSFFGDEVTPTQLVTKKNFKTFKDQFHKHSEAKYFYGALYSKLAEFASDPAEFEDSVRTESGYSRNATVASRAKAAKDKNLLFIFTEGNIRPADEFITFAEVADYQTNASHLVPKVYAFYYTGEGVDENVELTLDAVSTPRDNEGTPIADRQGSYKPSEDLSSVLTDFKQVVKDAMYDFAYTYRATKDRSYIGVVNYSAEWKGMEAGSADYTIGSVETPWPIKEQTAAATATKFLVALLIALLTFAFFFLIMKVLVPFIKSKRFGMKYYTKYVPEEGISRRICTYCRQNIEPGQLVVSKCKHIMHVACWQQNGYKCVEYGQNCKDGIQEHVEWKQMFSKASLRDTYQTLAGILAALVSWIIFELTGRGSMFHSVGEGIAKAFFTNEEQKMNLMDDCTNKVSAFLAIGLLLGFFLSLVFRYFDEYRKKDAGVYLKIFGLSLLTGIIGMAAMAVGGIIFCVLLNSIGTTYIPWYCSLPAYILFAVCVPLSLTIKSSIPLKSALIGGLIAAAIGFVVLISGSIGNIGWLNMLIDFIIFGGGLGASLVTVRMLAERYFLIIKNGVKAGQKIPIHKWMNATGGGNKVTIGATGDCEVQMNWEKSNKVAKEHVQLYIDPVKTLPMLKALATGVLYNMRTELPVSKSTVLTNGDTFKIGDTIFEYVEQ